MSVIFIDMRFYFGSISGIFFVKTCYFCCHKHVFVVYLRYYQLINQNEKMNTKKDKNILNETIINGSRVYVENGEVKTVLSEEIQKTGYMTVEEARKIGHEIIKKEYQLP